MKKTALVAAFVGLATASFAQIGLRNISSVSFDLYFNNETEAAANGGAIEKLALDLNQVLLFRLAPWLSGEVKIQRQDEEPVATTGTDGWHETTISIAPIFIVSDFNYIIVRYGLGIGTGYERPAGDLLTDGNIRGLSHDLTVDANHETARFLANITLRGSFYPDLDYWFLVPSAGIRYSFPFGLGVLARYFYSFNSQLAESHAFLSEIEFPVAPRVSLKVGGSGAVTMVDSVGQWEYTAIAGASFRVTDSLGLKYHIEYLGRQNRGPGMRNLLVLDARF